VKRRYRWYKTDAVVGVMFTEIVLDNKSVLSTILSRIGAVVRNGLDTDQFSRVTFTFHVFPMIGMRRILPAEQPDPLPGSRKNVRPRTG